MEKGVIGREVYVEMLLLLVLRIEGGRWTCRFSGGGGIALSEPWVRGRVLYSWAGRVRGGAGK